MKKRKKFLIIFCIFLIIVMIFFIKQLGKNENSKNNDIHENNSQFENDFITGEEKSNMLKQMRKEIGSKRNKVVLIINGEKITEKEIAHLDFCLNNTYGNKAEQEKDAVEEIIRRYVIYQDAQKRNISLTDERIKEIENRVKNDKDVEDLAKAFNLSRNKYCEMSVKSAIMLETNSMWHEELLDSIGENNLEFYDESFKDKYEEFNKSTEFSIKMQLLNELINMYEEHLVSQATIEYKD